MQRDYSHYRLKRWSLVLPIMLMTGALLPTSAVWANPVPILGDELGGLVNSLIESSNNPVSSLADDAADLGVGLLVTILEVIATFGVWLLAIVSDILGSVVSVGSFVTNPFVASGWPFLQGLANFGFILALLVIAITTALRVDLGGGVRRLLPRLLLGAILINFSLLIGGIIIDFSRLLMALFSNLAGSSVRELGPNILQRSEIVTSVFSINFSSQFNPSVESHVFVNQSQVSMLVSMAQAIIFIWGLMMGMFVIMVTLVIRYIVLLLLLIVSPLVYVAIAFPGLDRHAKKWWSTFLSNVFFGPIAMFALVMLATVGAGTSSFNGLGSPIVAQFLGLVITVAMLVFVATSGRRFGAYGAEAAMNFSKGTGRVARRGARIAASPVVDPLIRSITRPYRAYREQRKKDIEKRDKDLMDKGIVSRRFKKAAEAVGSPRKTYGSIQDRQAAQAISSNIKNDPTKISKFIPAAQTLSNPTIAGNLSKETYKAILDNKDPSGKQYKQELIAGTLQQSQISKEQVQTLNEHLRVTIKEEKDSAKFATDQERKLRRQAQLSRDKGKADEALKFEQEADKWADTKKGHEGTIKRASSQLKEAVNKKQYVDKLSDGEKSAIGLLDDSDISTALRNTLNKKDDDK